jgi:aspartate carbamoyltransferase catalytic subunit
MKKAETGRWTKKHLLGIEDLSEEEITIILDQADGFREVLARAIPKVPTLRGKTIATLFCEPSTRTRASFELAAKRLSADTLNVTVSSSSFLKGETLKDTARNIEAMQTDMIIIRHSCPGAPHFLARNIEASVVNAGDGPHEHPTQALLDLLTIRQTLGKIKGLNVSIIGDIAHSRVARSNILALTKMGAKVTVCGPKTMMPAEIEKTGVKVTYRIEEALAKADVINVLRIQLERQKKGVFPSIREYVRSFGIDKEKLARFAGKRTVIMHPGPINRGVELSHDVADSEHSVILGQVTNGVAVRMAVLFLLSQIKSGERGQSAKRPERAI